MLKNFLSVVIIAVLWAGTSLAEGQRTIMWDDLIPPGPPIDNPFRTLTEDQREDMSYMFQYKADVELGFVPEDSPAHQTAKEIIENFAKDGIDFAAFEAKLDEMDAEIERRNSEVNQDLDGKVIRMPGYALPLEVSDGGITEFLLVPYVGACIHTPPPPANQMVFVELAKEYNLKSLYDPVWITGTLKVQPANRSLYFVDGQADVATGYSLSGIAIEPYQ